MVLEQPGEAGRQLCRAGAQRRRRLAQQILFAGEVGFGRRASKRLDPAHPRGNRAFADDLEQPDIAGAAHMGPAAQLDRIGPLLALGGAPLSRTHRDDADLVAVFLAEQGHRAGGYRLVGRHQPRRNRLVRADLRVHLGFDGVDLLAGQRLRVREVEPEIVGRDQASLLGDMRSEMPAQCGMKQVRRAVVGPDSVAAVGVDLLMNDVADAQFARDNFRPEHVEFAERL